MIRWLPADERYLVIVLGAAGELPELFRLLGMAVRLSSMWTLHPVVYLTVWLTQLIIDTQEVLDLRELKVH